MKQLKWPLLFLFGGILLASCKNKGEKQPSMQTTPALSVDHLQDSIQKLTDELAEEQYFDIRFNEDGRYFFLDFLSATPQC